jgi:hypothetical protein
MKKSTMRSDFDTKTKDDLNGAISVRFVKGGSFADYCATHIANYDPERFEVMAIRFFYGNEIDITLYAVDTERLSASERNDDGIPVKKFRLPTTFLKDILPLIDDCNFTLTTSDYPLENMRVINK